MVDTAKNKDPLLSQLNPLDFEIHDTIERIKNIIAYENNNNNNNNSNNIPQRNNDPSSPYHVVIHLLHKQFYYNRNHGIYKKEDVIQSIMQLLELMEGEGIRHRLVYRAFFYYLSQLGSLPEMNMIVKRMIECRFYLEKSWYLIWLRTAVKEGTIIIPIDIETISQPNEQF